MWRRVRSWLDAHLISGKNPKPWQQINDVQKALGSRVIKVTLESYPAREDPKTDNSSKKLRKNEVKTFSQQFKSQNKNSQRKPGCDVYQLKRTKI